MMPSALNAAVIVEAEPAEWPEVAALAAPATIEADIEELLLLPSFSLSRTPPPPKRSLEVVALEDEDDKVEDEDAAAAAAAAFAPPLLLLMPMLRVCVPCSPDAY